MTDYADLLRGLRSLTGPFPRSAMQRWPRTPQDAFKAWLEEAIEHNVLEPHAMTLSTVDSAGAPDARLLILKNVDQMGWWFACDAKSPKGKQINECPAVALTFYWRPLGRQIRIRGTAERASESACAKDFLARSKSARIISIASSQSDEMADDAFNQALHEAERKVDADPQYVSPSWGLYAVSPTEVEFWQGASDRAHKRVKYVRDDDKLGWRILSLQP